MEKFKVLNLNEKVLRGIENAGFTEPTTIQSEVIPLILDGNDVLAQAPTGTGKTCAFGLPIINNIDLQSTEIEVLIMCPTRELVMQTVDELKKVSEFIESLRILAIYGGQSIDRQLASLRRRPQIVVGTPGRVIDHLNRRTIKLHNLKMLVLDEADEMLNMGFREDIDRIVKECPSIRQTVLFSATMPREISELSDVYQTNAKCVKVKLKDSDLPDIKQIAVLMEDGKKNVSLLELMSDYGFNRVIVFSNTKHKADKINKLLAENGYISESIHSDIRQAARTRIMKSFKQGELQVLVATDVAARGIDVDEVEAIINYDIPADREFYVHRIGRTARANKSGMAFTFYNKGQADLIERFERFTKISMEKRFSKSANPQEVIAYKIKTALEKEEKNDKEIISSVIEQYNADNNTEFTALDILAGMISPTDVIIKNDDYTSDARNDGRNRNSDDRNSGRPERRERSDSRDDNNGRKGTRYFINIGTRDNANETNMKKFVTSNTTVAETDICDLLLLENFGFIEVTGDAANDISLLNGLSFDGRSVTVELAGGRSSGGRSSGGRDSRGGGRSFGGAPRSGSGERSFGGAPRSGSGERSFGGAPRSGSGERSFGGSSRSGSGERSFGERSGSGERSFGGAPRSNSGERSFGGSSRSSSGERSFGGAPRSNSGERSFGERSGSSERSNSGERSFGGSSRSSSGERSFGGSSRSSSGGSFGGSSRSSSGGSFGGSRGGAPRGGSGGAGRSSDRPFRRSGV